MDGFKSVSKPTPEVMHWLSEVLTQIEDAGAWDDGCVLRSVIIEEYGLEGLRAIEEYGVYASAYREIEHNGAIVWRAYNDHTGVTEFLHRTIARQTAGIDPWATAREAKRRKDEIRRTMRGEYTPPWFNRGE